MSFDSIFLSVGIACGIDELGPEATIVSNAKASAPLVFIYLSSSNAISFSVCPGLIYSFICSNALSVIKQAFLQQSISSSSLTNLFISIK